MTAGIIFQKGIQLSSWSDWSKCDWSTGGWSTDNWSTCEMKRSRLCLTGCESFNDDLTQTQACNKEQCPGKNLLPVRTIERRSPR